MLWSSCWGVPFVENRAGTLYYFLVWLAVLGFGVYGLLGKTSHLWKLFAQLSIVSSLFIMAGLISYHVFLGWMFHMTIQ